MDSIFKKLNDNSLVAMYGILIDEVVRQSKEYKISLLQTYFNEMQIVDKSSLSDKNLGIYEALEFFLTDMEFSMENKSKRYKKNFLYMLDVLCSHEKAFGVHTDDKLSFGKFDDMYEENKQYTKQ